MENCLLKKVMASATGDANYLGYIKVSAVKGDSYYSRMTFSTGGVLKALNGTFRNGNTEISFTGDQIIENIIPTDIDVDETFDFLIPKYCVRQITTVPNINVNFQDFKFTTDTLKRFSIQTNGCFTGLDLSNCEQEVTMGTNNMNYLVYGDWDTLKLPQSMQVVQGSSGTVRVWADLCKCSGDFVGYIVREKAPYMIATKFSSTNIPTINLNNLNGGHERLLGISIYNDNSPALLTQVTGNLETALMNAKNLQYVNCYQSTQLSGRIDVILDHWVTLGRTTGTCQFDVNNSKANVTIDGINVKSVNVTFDSSAQKGYTYTYTT